MKSLILDSNWNLKRNFMKRANMFAKGEHCGGSFGYLDSLRSILQRVMPDKTISFWDGNLGGILRYNIFPQYKQNRNKSWDSESYILTDELISAEEKRNKYSFLQQKIKVKNYLEELFIRQTEVEEIEADDLIAHYVNTKPEDEEIIIFSSDKDYLQLIGKNVSVLRPPNKKGETENILITINNFKEKFGYTHENTLILKCFEGDVSDSIPGIFGVSEKTMIKNFPKFADEPYTIDRLIEEAAYTYENSKKKPKFLEKVIGSRRTFERNKKLMNLREPFINEEAIQEIRDMRNLTLINEDGTTDRGIMNATRMMVADGYSSLVWQNDLSSFMVPFHRLAVKEKENFNRLKNI